MQHDETKKAPAQSVISFRVAIFQNSQHNPIWWKKTKIASKYGPCNECVISYSSWFRNSTPDAIYNTCLLLQALCLTRVFSIALYFPVKTSFVYWFDTLVHIGIDMEMPILKCLTTKKWMQLQIIKCSACPSFYCEPFEQSKTPTTGQAGCNWISMGSWSNYGY